MSHGTTHEDAPATACAGAGCLRREAAGQARRLPAAASRLCPSCRDRLVLELRRLPDLYEDCALRLSSAAGGLREKTSGGPMPGMPFNSPASDVRSAILGVLGCWAGTVVDERRLTGPGRAVAPLAAFLIEHADWLAAHSAAGELCGEVAQLVRRARRVIDPEGHRRVALGDCVEEGCTGALTAAVRPHQPQMPAEITCDAHPEHRWFGHQWLQLSRRLGAARAAAAAAASAPAAPPSPPTVSWMTAADIARLWAVAPGSVYRHASQQKWRRLSRSGRTYYHGSDVSETLSRRTARAAG